MTSLSQAEIGEAAKLLNDLAQFQRRYGRSDKASDIEALANWIHSDPTLPPKNSSRPFNNPT